MLICALVTIPLVEQVMPFDGIVIVAEAASTKKAKLNRTSLKLTKGKSYTLKVANAGGKKIKWSSKKKKVATVSSKGKVTAKGKGTTYVYAKVGKKKLKCKVTVKEPAVVRKYTIDSGKSKSLTFSGATSKTRWKVSDPSIATLSATKGKKVTLKVKKSGRVTVTATTSGRKPYRFEITVKGKPETLPSKPTPSQTEAPQTETNPPQTETNPPQTETPETLPPQTEPTHPETNPPQTETNPPQPETPKPPVETEKPVEPPKETESETTPEKPPVDPSKKDSNYFYDAKITPSGEFVVNDIGRVSVYAVSHEDGWLDYRFSYSSSDSSVIVVDDSGGFRCLSMGSAVLTARGSDGVVIDKFTVNVGKSENSGQGITMEVDYSNSRLNAPYSDFLIINVRTSAPVSDITYEYSNVNSRIPEIGGPGIAPTTSGFEVVIQGWLAGTYNVTLRVPGANPLVVPVTVTSSDPDWVEYNNWMYRMLSSEWKADTRLDTFLKMGAWLVDNRNYDASNTQFQRLWRDGVGGDCVAYTMLFTDVARRVFGLKAYNSNQGVGHEKAIVEIGDEKWGFDAGFTGLAGERRFTAVEINRKEQWKYSTEMTADGLVRGWTHRTS